MAVRGFSPEIGCSCAILPKVTRTPGYLLFVALFQATCGTGARGRHRGTAFPVVCEFPARLLGVLAAHQVEIRSAALPGSLPGLLFLPWCGSQSAERYAVFLFLTLCVACAIAWLQSPSALDQGHRNVPERGDHGEVGGTIGLGTGHGGDTAPRGPRLALERVIHSACFLIAVGLVLGPWLIRNQVYFRSPFLTKFAGRSLWWSCFRESSSGSINRPIPFAEDGRAMQTIRQTVPDVDGRDTWKIYKGLVRCGYSQIDADDLMFCLPKKRSRHIHGASLSVVRLRRLVLDHSQWNLPPEHGGLSGPATEFADPARLPEVDEYAGQAAWKSNWYFTQGRLNFLWHPHPLLYAAAAVITLGRWSFYCARPRSAARHFSWGSG